MSKSLKLNSLLGALIAVAVSAGVLTAPAKAAEQVTLTIWTFGEVIQQGLQREYQKLQEKHIRDSGALLDGARRAMRASYQREMDVIEARLDFLGSVGSVSPYIGLFGTVWGIMNAFTGLSSMQQVTLATVAPGIAEALVATAIGLFAAIPAVLAYNNFSRDIDRIATHLESFIEEFSNILARNTQPAAGAEAARPATNVR